MFRPVDGLLSQREFLNTIAFNSFSSTQYIRHHSKPLYTPEPDLCHEYFGHAIMFADKQFCQFSQEIGLASLGATDEEIKNLGTIYWFTIEYGLCLEGLEKKAYGAGIFSSPSELENALSGKPTVHEFDIEKIANFKEFAIDAMNWNYFLAPSYSHVIKEVKKYVKAIRKNKPFQLSYDDNTNSLIIDKI